MKINFKKNCVLLIGLINFFMLNNQLYGFRLQELTDIPIENASTTITINTTLIDDTAITERNDGLGIESQQFSPLPLTDHSPSIFQMQPTVTFPVLVENVDPYTAPRGVLLKRNNKIKLWTCVVNESSQLQVLNSAIDGSDKRNVSTGLTKGIVYRRAFKGNNGTLLASAIAAVDKTKKGMFVSILDKSGNKWITSPPLDGGLVSNGSFINMHVSPNGKKAVCIWVAKDPKNNGQRLRSLVLDLTKPLTKTADFPQPQTVSNTFFKPVLVNDVSINDKGQALSIATLPEGLTDTSGENVSLLLPPPSNIIVNAYDPERGTWIADISPPPPTISQNVAAAAKKNKKGGHLENSSLRICTDPQQNNFVLIKPDFDNNIRIDTFVFESLTWATPVTTGFNYETNFGKAALQAVTALSSGSKEGATFIVFLENKAKLENRLLQFQNGVVKDLGTLSNSGESYVAISEDPFALEKNKNAAVSIAWTNMKTARLNQGFIVVD